MTTAVTKEFLGSKLQDFVEDEIKTAFDATKDEAKRIYLLADSIEKQFVRYRDQDVADKIFRLADELRNSPKSAGDENLGKMLGNLGDLIAALGGCVDCYEVAKTLIARNKKQQSITKKQKRSGKNLTILKKTA